MRQKHKTNQSASMVFWDPTPHAKGPRSGLTYFASDNRQIDLIWVVETAGANKSAITLFSHCSGTSGKCWFGQKSMDEKDFIESSFP